MYHWKAECWGELKNTQETEREREGGGERERERVM